LEAGGICFAPQVALHAMSTLLARKEDFQSLQNLVEKVEGGLCVGWKAINCWGSVGDFVLSFNQGKIAVQF